MADRAVIRSVSLRPETFERLEQARKETGWPRSTLVGAAIEHLLDSERGQELIRRAKELRELGLAHSGRS